MSVDDRVTCAATSDMSRRCDVLQTLATFAPASFPASCCTEQHLVFHFLTRLKVKWLPLW